MNSDPRHVQRERDALLKLHQISRLMGSEQKLGKLLHMILDHAIELSRAERGFVILRDAATGGYDVRVARNIGKEVIDHPQFKVSRGIIDEAWKTAQPVVLQDAQEDAEFGARKSVIRLKLASVACIPLKWRGEIHGVLYLDNRFRKGLFEPGDMMVMELFADHAASALGQIRVRTELEEKTAQQELLNAKLLEANRDLERRIQGNPE